MDVRQMKITVPSKNYSIVELYDTVAALMGKETENLKYDCRQINIASNIQDSFFARYREENQDLSDDDFKMNMNMILVCYGTKVDETLSDNEVEIFEGFIC